MHTHPPEETGSRFKLFMFFLFLFPFGPIGLLFGFPCRFSCLV